MKPRILIACIRAALAPMIVAGALAPVPAGANPSGGVVVAGTASITQPGAGTLLVRNASGTVINWKAFSIGAGETTIFDQTSAASWVLNRVTGSDVSRIYGHLQSNGKVFLINQNGIFVGRGALIDTAGFVGSTLGIADADLAEGRLRFAKDDKAGMILNRGVIRTHSGGNVMLLAPRIENAGTIEAPGGQVILAAGQKATIASLDLDGVAFEVQAPTDAVLNLGKLLADDGAVRVFAGNLRHGGEIRANAITRDAGGEILLAARADLTVTAAGTLRADGPSGGSIRLESATGTTRVAGRIGAIGSAGEGGRIDVLGRQVSLTGRAAADASGAAGGGTLRIGGDYQGANPDVPNAVDAFVAAGVRLNADATREGNGGRIIVWSDRNTRYLGRLSARGGPLGGDGGFAEVSGKGNLLFLGGANLGAPRGAMGELLLDPLDLFVDALGGLNPYVINEAADFPAHAITVTPATLAAITGNVSLYASRDLRFNSAVTLAGPGQGLSAHAGRDLQLGAAITTNGGAVSLDATRDLSTFAATAINTSGGAVTLRAGRNLSGSSLNVNAGTGAVSESTTAGALTAGTVSGSGSLTLAAVGGNLSTSNLTGSGPVTLSSASGSVSTGTVTSGGAIGITGATSVGTSNLTSNGGAVTVRANGSSLSTGTINTQAGAGPAGGAISITAASSASVSGATAGSGNVAISGTSVSTGTLTSTGNVGLTATSGSISATVNDAAGVTASATRSLSSTSVSITSTSATTPLNATSITATAVNCSFSSSCPGATITLTGNMGVNVGTVTASAPATSNVAAPFNSISETVTINGQNGPIHAMSAASQVTAANVSLITTQGAGGGIGTAAQSLKVNVERLFTFRPNGEFNVVLNGTGPNRLDMQLGAAATGTTYTGTLTKAGQVNLAASATDTTVTVSDFTVSGGFDDLVFNNSPLISLNVPNGSLVAQNVAMPAGDQTGRNSLSFPYPLVYQPLPVTLSARDNLTVDNYARTDGAQVKSTTFSSSLGSVTLGAVNAAGDSVSVTAPTDFTLVSSLATRGNVTINAATGVADTGNVTLGGTGIDTSAGSGSVTINASSALAGQGEVHAAADAPGLEIRAGGSLAISARNIDTAGFANPLDVQAPSVSLTSTGTAIGHAGSPVVANTANLTVNASGNFSLDTGATDLTNLTVTASPGGVGAAGLAQVTTNGNTYAFASDGTDFTLSGWTSAGTQFTGGTLRFNSTSGSITLADIDFSATNGNLWVHAQQLVSGNVTQTLGSGLDLGSGVLTVRADNNVVLRDFGAGGLSVSQANNQVFSPVASNGSCETIGSGFVCAPNSVTLGHVTDPTGTGAFSATARHGITTGNLAVGSLNLHTHTGTVATGTIGTAGAPASSVVITADNYNTYAGGSIAAGAIEANSLSMSTLNGNIATGAINAVNTGGASVQLTANNGNVTVAGTIDAGYVELRASGAGATGNISTGHINPDAAATIPGTINLYADTSIATGTLDADQINATGWSCCPTYPAITTGAIGSRLPGSYLYVSGSDVSLGAISLDAAGAGQTLEVRGTNNVTVTGNVSMGQGGDSLNPARLDAGNLLTFNGGNGVFSATDGSAILLRAGNALVATPLAFRRVDAGAAGWVTVESPAGIRQTLETGGIRAGTVILKATAAGSSIHTQEGANPVTTLTLEETTNLTVEAGGDMRIRLTGTSGAPDLANLDITRAKNDATFILNDGVGGPGDLNAHQSLTVVDNGSGVDLTLANVGAAPMNFRYRNTDGSGNIVVKGTGVATQGGFVKLESATGQVSSDPAAAIDSTGGVLGDGAVTIAAATGIDLAAPVTAGGAAVTMSTGGNLSGTSTITGGTVSLSASLGDIGDGLGGAIAVAAPTVALTATRDLGPGVGGTVKADLTGTTAVSVNADAGFTVASNTTLASAAITTRGDQAGPLALSAPGQSFGLSRNLTTVELGSVASGTPLTAFSLTVNAGDLTVVGTGASQVAAATLQLTTAGILTLDGTGSPVVLSNTNQAFSATGDLVVSGQASLAATGNQQFLGGQGGTGDVVFQPSGGGIVANAANQTFSATRDLLFDGGAASSESIALGATQSQSFTASRDIRLAGGAGDAASVGVTLAGDGGQYFSAGRNLDLAGGAGTGAAVAVSMTGSGNQTLNASGNTTLAGGTGDAASVLVSASGTGSQSFYAGGNLALAGGGIAATTADASVLVLKAGSGTQNLDAGGAINLTGGPGDGGSATVRNTGTGNQVLGDNYCCSNPTDSLSLAGGAGANSFVLVENAGTGRQYIQPVVSLSLAGGAGDGAYARIHNANPTSGSTSVSGGPQIIGYSNSFDCCSGDQIDTMSITGGAGIGAYAEISSAGSQRLAFGTSITIAGGSGDGAFGRVTAKAQDLRTGAFVLTAGTGDGADASIVASGTEADRTSGSSALQVLDPGNLTMTAGGTAGANAAAAYITSGGTQRVTASTTLMTGGSGPNSVVRIAAAGNQNLSFGTLTLQGGTGANTRAAIESQSGGQTLSASTTQLLGGTGAAGAGQDAGALIINNAGTQSLSMGNLTIRSGADYAPAGIANLGTTQSLSAGAVTIGTTAGANGVSASPLGGNNTAAIGNLGSGNQSLSTSSFNIDNQFGNGDIGVFSGTTQSVNTGTVTVNNATASGIARIDSAGTQSFSAGSVTVTSAGAAGEARITAGGAQTFSDSGVMTVQVTAGAGTARVTTSSGAQSITSSGGLRVQATGGTGTARIAAPAGQTITTAFVDVNTGAAATGNAEITAVGDQSIHTTNGLAAGTGSLRVAALGTGTARVESGAHQLLEIDYPELMQAARDGRITVGNSAALGVSLLKGRSQDIFAKSITLQGGSAAGSEAKLDATTTQNISTLKGGISVTGGAGGNASLDPTDQVIVTGGPIDVTGGSGAGVTGAIASSGTQVILSTLGDITITGGTALNAFGMITTTGATTTVATVGDIVLTPGTAGLNADAVITSGTRVVNFACGLGATPTCAPPDLPADPFGNSVSDFGIFRSPVAITLGGVTAVGVDVDIPVYYVPVDTATLILGGGGDEDKRGGLLLPEEEEPRLRMARPLGVCR